MGTQNNVKEDIGSVSRCQRCGSSVVSRCDGPPIFHPAGHDLDRCPAGHCALMSREGRLRRLYRRLSYLAGMILASWSHAIIMRANHCDRAQVSMPIVRDQQLQRMATMSLARTSRAEFDVPQCGSRQHERPSSQYRCRMHQLRGLVFTHPSIFPGFNCANTGAWMRGRPSHEWQGLF